LELPFDNLNANEFQFTQEQLMEFIPATQPNQHAEIEENHGSPRKNLPAPSFKYG